MILAWGAKISADDRELVLSIARDIGCDPSDLMACIWFESNGNPAAVNAQSGATGIIQFTPGTAIGLGTTVDLLADMTFGEQLRYVLAYFRLYAGRLHSLADTYMAILYPRAIGEPDEFTLFAEMDPKTRKAYLQNRGLDIDHDGDVSKIEATSFPARRLAEGLQAGNVWDDGTAPAVEPAEPIPTPFQPTPTPAQPETPMGAIALPLLQSLLPSVLQLFSGRAQATIAEKTGADPQLAQQFMQGLIQQIGGAVGMPQVKSDAEAIQAVGELHKQIEEQKTQAAAQSAAQTALVKKLEADSLDYLHDLTQAMKDVVAVRAGEVQIETDSANAASARTDAGLVRERIDRKVWWAYGIGAAVLGSIAIAELWITKIVDGQIVGALILAFGALGGAIITMVNYGYGSSGSSGAKDVLIGEMARRQAKDK